MAEKIIDLNPKQKAQYDKVITFLESTGFQNSYEGKVSGTSGKSVVDTSVNASGETTTDSLIIISKALETFAPLTSYNSKQLSQHAEFEKDLEKKLQTKLENIVNADKFRGAFAWYNEKELADIENPTNKLKLSSKSHAGIRVSQLAELEAIVDDYNKQNDLVLQSTPKTAPFKEAFSAPPVTEPPNLTEAQLSTLFSAPPAADPINTIEVTIPLLKPADVSNERTSLPPSLSSLNIPTDLLKHSMTPPAPNIKRAEMPAIMPEISASMAAPEVFKSLAAADYPFKNNTTVPVPEGAKATEAAPSKTGIFAALQKAATPVTKEPVFAYDMQYCGGDRTSAIFPCQQSCNKVSVVGLADAYKDLKIHPAKGKDVEISAFDAFANANGSININVMNGGKLQVNLTKEQIESLKITEKDGQTTLELDGKKITTKTPVMLGLRDENGVASSAISVKDALMEIAKTQFDNKQAPAVPLEIDKVALLSQLPTMVAQKTGKESGSLAV